MKVGLLGQNQRINEISKRHNERKETHMIWREFSFSNVYIHKECKIRKNDDKKSKIPVGINERSSEIMTFERKKYDKSVKTKETILALVKRAIVLTDATIKIFWLKKSEYNPKA